MVFLACEPVGQTATDAVEVEERIPSQESWNSTVLISSAGQQNVTARADYLVQFEEPREIEFIGHVKLDFYNSDGTHSSVMTADTGHIDDRRRLFTATGDVYVVSDSGMTLRTTRLLWNEKKEIIFTEETITFTSEMDTLYGIGFESDASLENWTILQPTGVTYREMSDE